MNFTDFNLHPSLLEGLDAMGFETPTPIQEQAIPPILEGRDIIGSAQTGTGKTAAFLLPVINSIVSSGDDTPGTKAMVIVPTRELALQIDQQMEGFSFFTPVSSIAIYGGGDGSLFMQEKKALEEGAEVVICTPGRMIAHLNSSYANFENLKYLILDEADRMLDMGFIEDIQRIIQSLPQKRQNLLFAATMPPKIRAFAKKILNNPTEVSIAISKPAENILQVAYLVYETQKVPLVTHILKDQDLKSVIVFCSTKIGARELSSQLKKEKLNVKDIHSDLDQKTREEVLLKFRNRKVNILVATDILSRGIDVEDIELIINFDVPQEGEDYIHRIGRTARAESEGVAITLISEDDQFRFSKIESLLEKPVTKIPPPPQFGESPEYNPEKHRRSYMGKKPNKGRKPHKGNKGKSSKKR